MQQNHATSTSTFIVLVTCCSFAVKAMKAERQLYEDLLYLYNKVARPVKNASEVLEVKFGASLIRIIDVDEKNQVLTTNLWLEMQWTDSKLTWNPENYAGIKKLHIPAEYIWTPDILLYNCADGHPHVTINTDALVYYDGKVLWKPPGIYKSFCQIDIQYFPYDLQRCYMKFGGWTYNGFYLDMRQIPTSGHNLINTADEFGRNVWRLHEGMDLSYFYESSGWDLLELTSDRHEVLYPGCCGQDFYIDITFYITLRRKTLFYTVNLILPCMLIAILTTFVFYLPTSCRDKITFSISILVTLIVFVLVLVDLIPPTSLVIPLIAKFLLFTLSLVTVSIIVSVITLDINHRDGCTHKMPKWIRWLFLKKLPRLLHMKLPEKCESPKEAERSRRLWAKLRGQSEQLNRRQSGFFQKLPPTAFLRSSNSSSLASSMFTDGRESSAQPNLLFICEPDQTRRLLQKLIANVNFIAAHIAMLEYDQRLSDEWSYVASVVDRVFMILFSVVNLLGTIVFVAQSPILYDISQPLPVPVKTQPLGGDTLSHLY
ncbi:Acetylcholine receptor subunit alpha-like [Trichinella spiralis]|uniref:Acetylcholine receptor subunit alpha-like n=1 Tax=Trichinella spiralis TaxID=6334 RepID=A0ABR3K3N2_TRISP